MHNTFPSACCFETGRAGQSRGLRAASGWTASNCSTERCSGIRMQWQGGRRQGASGALACLSSKDTLSNSRIEFAYCDAGTYAGITENLGYLKSLGINAIELLPVHEFNEMEYYRVGGQRSGLAA